MIGESAPGVNGEVRVIPRHEESLMGLPILLLNSAVEMNQEGENVVGVKEPEALEVAVAVARLAMKEKLAGNEIKFLRKAAGERAAALAEYLDVRAETFSKWENGKEPISQNAEKLFRLRIFDLLKDKVPGSQTKASDILNLKIVPFRATGMRMTFELLRAFVPGFGVKHVWCQRDSDDIDVMDLRRA
jgi:DNA-binding transcriptional regulator YiaG